MKIFCTWFNIDIVDIGESFREKLQKTLEERYNNNKKRNGWKIPKPPKYFGQLYNEMGGVDQGSRGAQILDICFVV